MGPCTSAQISAHNESLQLPPQLAAIVENLAEYEFEREQRVELFTQKVASEPLTDLVAPTSLIKLIPGKQ